VSSKEQVHGSRLHQSLEAEVRAILEQASGQPGWEDAWDRIDAFRERMAASGRTFSDTGELLGRMRDVE